MNHQTLNVAVVGGTGYSGGELCRLLLNHPHVGSIWPTARGDEEFERIHANLRGSSLSFVTLEDVQARVDELDVVFFCTPSGQAMRQAGWFLERDVKVVDVSADFRFADPATYQRVYGTAHAAPELLAEAAYGVTELNREAIAKSRLVANPGCYVITAILGLTPLLRAGWADLNSPLHLSAVNGTTGAGNKPKRPIMHAEALNSMLPYSMEGHRHGPELETHLAVAAGRDLVVDFNTAHGNFARGIHLQANLAVNPDLAATMSRERLLGCLTEFYGAGAEGEFFVRVNDLAKSGGLNAKDYDVYPGVASVTGSNFCHIGADYDERRGIIKILSVTDNLVKGAAGSAIQNMNVMLGLEETLALRTYGL
ncbi:N-acetyl-gamma-glutamyl-phosphate reductase [Streptomyces sp. BG9H]|uniref:N-acetyl-gamma-glutamyl-phosphate reductase n=1 Tax=Streptomyces anatolicus TaxID=2675858 RepID=A0ABS6YHM9_9ACTN|nr:N-acetyl-gamma-glutamyl-phosphate reductase [Streptomyces anatolicus]